MNALRRKAQQLQLWRKFNTKHCRSTHGAAAEVRKVKPNYDEFMHARQEEAKRSIVVQVNSEKSFTELYNYCSAFGNIVNAQHYCTQHEETMHYILLEFSSAEQAAAAINASAYNDELTGVPAHSSFLWFKAATGGKRKAGLKHSNNTATLNTINGTQALDKNELQTLLREAANIEEQLDLLYTRTRLNDLGVRMRFLAARQVEQSLVGMFPDAIAQPFGSSVNGFGKMGCDLDLILRLDRANCNETALKERAASRLIFHSKANFGNGRTQTQRQMECIGDMLSLFLPGVGHVRRILQARVPIIKYHHEHLDLEVDLSMSNLTGFYMSELLYMFGEMDARVRPLTFCIRRWANACGLTNPSPGRWITNFSLTCLVMFFLQQTKQPILPPINMMVKNAAIQDIRITEDGINCTFGRDLKRIEFKSRNDSKLSVILLQFFEFYSQFDFQNRAISLNEGRALAKPDHSALYIVNPLEQMLNVSKNVSLEECERFRIEVRNAAWLLESEVEMHTMPEHEKKESSWGLLSLFRHPEKSIIRPNMFFKPRMVEVSDLFEKPTTTETTTTTPAYAPSSPQSTDETTYRNASVRHQVENIKATARIDIKQMRANAVGTAVAVDDNVTTPFNKRRRSR